MSNDYKNHWKLLIDDTFNSVVDYDEKLIEVWNKLNKPLGTYNYLVYTQLINYLDPITQLMIYYRQNDNISFNDEKYNDLERFLALFLLKDKNLKNYLNPIRKNYYYPFIDMLEGKTINKKTLGKMLIEMARNGSALGVKFLLEKGADVHAPDNYGENDYALREASRYGYLDVVKLLINYGSDIHAENDYALRYASQEGHLDVVKYLVEQGANINANHDLALISASQNGHLNVVKYLVEKGADIHGNYDSALSAASQNGHLDVVKYLVEHGANIHANNNQALRFANMKGHLDVVKYLQSLP